MNFNEFHFLRPWWLVALLPAAALLLMLLRRRQGEARWLEVCDAELLPYLLHHQALQQRRSSLLPTALAGILTILALAGPTWQRLPSPAFRNDSALVIALNLSTSMDATDIKPSRIAKARYKIADLLKQRKDGQTALLVYGGDAFTVTPLTSDTATIASQLEALDTDIMPSPGSNAERAVHKAVGLLQQAGVAQGHILLITDTLDADNIDAVQAELAGHHLSVLGIGSHDGAPISQPGGGFVKDADGNIVIARLDDANLQSLATKGQGLYRQVSADDGDIEQLGKLFNSIDAHGDKTQENNLLLQQWDELGPWLLLLVLPWAALRFRKGLLVWLGVCLLLPYPQTSEAVDWQSWWQNANQRAQQAFSQQNFQQAASEFTDPDWRAAAQYKAGEYQEAAETLKNTQSTDGFYNLGNALAQTGQLAEALKAYQQALTLNPAHEDARYNKELVEKRLQEQQKQQDDQQQKSGQDSPQQNDQQSKSANKQNPSAPAEDGEKQPSPQQADAQNQAESGDKPQAEAAKQPADAAQQKPADAQAAQSSQPPADNNAARPSSAAELEKNEQHRADEQLLKRIPDEPTGLLKRKFKYQYSQQGSNPAADRKW